MAEWQPLKVQKVSRPQQWNRPSWFLHRAQIRGLEFSRYQNNRGLPCAYVTCIYCSLSVKINMRKMPHGVQRSWTHCISFVVGKNPKTPNLSPMALGFPVYIYGAGPYYMDGTSFRGSESDLSCANLIWSWSHKSALEKCIFCSGVLDTEHIARKNPVQFYVNKAKQPMC